VLVAAALWGSDAALAAGLVDPPPASTR
jgi:hypothetical protein